MSACARPSTNRWRPSLPASLILIAVATLAAGEPPPDVAPGLSADDLVALARRRHPQAGLALAERAVAAATQRGARAWRDPSLEAELGRARARVGDDDAGIGLLSLVQPLDLAGRQARVAAAGHGLAAATAAGDAEWLAVEHAVRAAAVTCWQRQGGAAAASAGAEIAEQIRSIAARRVAAGDAPRSDLLRAEVDALRARQAAAEGERALHAAVDDLRLLCGDFAGFPAPPTPGEPQLPTRAAAETAAAAHPRLVASAAALAQADAALAHERAARWPEVELGVFAAREADADEFGVGIGIALPVWDGNRSAVDGAIAARRRAEAAQAAERLDRQRAVVAAWHAAGIAAERAAAAQAVLRPAREALALAQRAYDAGASALTDLLDARRTVQEVEEAALVAAGERHLARLALLHAIGSFSPLPGDRP